MFSYSLFGMLIPNDSARSLGMNHESIKNRPSSRRSSHGLGFPRNDILQKRVDRVLVPAPFLQSSLVREVLFGNEWMLIGIDCFMASCGIASKWDEAQIFFEKLQVRHAPNRAQTTFPEPCRAAFGCGLCSPELP